MTAVEICHGGRGGGGGSGSPGFRHVEVPGQPSVVELWRPILTNNTQTIKGDETRGGPLIVEAPGQPPSLPGPKSGPG